MTLQDRSPKIPYIHQSHAGSQGTLFHPSESSVIDEGDSSDTLLQGAESFEKPQWAEQSEVYQKSRLEASPHRSSYLSRRRMVILASGVLLVLGTMYASTSKSDNVDVSVLRNQSKASTSASQAMCQDPWASPGYTWYGPHTKDIRYVPYNSLENLVDPSSVVDLDPTKHFNASHDPHLPPDLPLPPELSRWFASASGREEHADDLEFMRNKHIVAFGSSIDCYAVRDFCKRHGNAHTTKQSQRLETCHFASHNFTISQWHSLGLHNSDWYHGADPPALGLTIKDRFEHIFKEQVELHGKPDLLVFSSGLWDIKYLHDNLRRNDPEQRLNTYLPLTYNELLWHRTRLEDAINWLRETFSDSYIMYRTTTEQGARREIGDDYPIAVFQLNQSSRALMKKLRMPIFNWADIVTGDLNEHRDTMHFQTESRANWLYGEMLLWHLQQISNLNSNTQCWLDR